jgi:CRISPR-associated protein Cmr6
MVFEKAFQKAKDEATKKGKEPEIEISAPTQQVQDSDPELVPMMYRAQIKDRCSLQFAGNNKHLKDWTEQWIYPNSEQNGQPHYQRQEPKLGLDGKVYRLKISFPFRVLSDCGQDTILRPSIGKDGIPFIPGSSIKGLFRRLLWSDRFTDQEKAEIEEYCGSQDKAGTLRFYGAYPVGDWAGTRPTKNSRNGTTETRYRMVDVLHPQQSRQVEGADSPTALALISLYQPTLIFELSSSCDYGEKKWERIAGLLRRALRPGLGGKTSTGYGLYVIPKDRFALSVTLKGIGVSSLLRNDEPEFRPNLFKAGLRGHASRLLAGVCKNSEQVKQQINRLFGDTTAPGIMELYWEWKPEHLKFEEFEVREHAFGGERTPIYQIRGTLYLDVRQGSLPKNIALDQREKGLQELETKRQQTLKFVKALIQFAYVMGGFGKSWRRVWHKNPDAWRQQGFPEFLPSYTTRAIGCHWEWLDSSFDPMPIKNEQQLTEFLQSVYQTAYQTAQEFMKPYQSGFCQWKEAWHPSRVAVYCNTVPQSTVIDLFHQSEGHPFKTTPAVCGKKLVKRSNRKTGQEEDLLEFSTSSVWHRMLPLDSGQYLEIVSLFHGERNLWEHEQGNQLQPFIKDLENAKKLQLIWGNSIH